MPKVISVQALQRLPLYLQYLKTLPDAANISARALGAALGFGEIQVRKDLASVSDGGRPKVGYVVAQLRHDIACALGYDNVNDAVLVGAGRLGRALMSYEGFSDYGLNIVAAFDADPAACGQDDSGKQVFPLEKLPDLCRRMKIEIGIVTVPARAAQGVCELLCESGIRAVWNFAPAHVTVPAGVLLKNENMAASLAVLSQHLAAEDAPVSDSVKEKAK